MSSFLNQTQNYIPRYVSDEGIWTVLLADLAIFVACMIFFLCLKDRSSFTYYFKPQAGRRRCEFYPSGIIERRDIRQRQIERMNSLKIKRPTEIPSENQDSIVGGESDLHEKDADVPLDSLSPAEEGQDLKTSSASFPSQDPFNSPHPFNQASKKQAMFAPSVTSISGVWRWLWTTLKIPDSTIFRIYGIDVWAYLQFLKFCIAVFFILTIIGITVYLPTNMTGGNEMKGFNGTCLGNVPAKDPRAYVHLAGVYVITFVIIVLSFTFVKQFTRYRQRYKKLALLNNFSCIVTNVPLNKGVTTSAKLFDFFQNLYPNQVASATLLFDLKPLERKIKERERFLMELDRSIAVYQQTGIRPRHSLSSIASSLSPKEKKLLGLEAPNETDKKAASSTSPSSSPSLGTPPSSQFRSKLHSQTDIYEVDSLNWYQEMIDELDQEIEMERRRVEEAEDIQEAVPVVQSTKGQHSIGIGIAVIPSNMNLAFNKSSSNISISGTPTKDHQINLYHHHHHKSYDTPPSASIKTSPSSNQGDSIINMNVSHSTSSPNLPKMLLRKQKSMLWRLSKNFQPDRENDDDILNEPFEESDIPSDPPVDPRPPPMTPIKHDITNPDAFDPPRDESSSHDQRKALSSPPKIDIAISKDPALSNPSDPASTPTTQSTHEEDLSKASSAIPSHIHPEIARRMNRSLTRRDTIGSFKDPNSPYSLNSSNLAIGVSIPTSVVPGTAAINSVASLGYPEDLKVSHHPSSHVQDSSSISSSHESISRVHQRSSKNGMNRDLSSLGSSSASIRSQASHRSAHDIPPPPAPGAADYDIDEDEEEINRKDQEESFMDRMMISIPGIEWFRRMYNAWIVKAQTKVYDDQGNLLEESEYVPTTVGFVTFKTLVAANHCAHSGYLSKSFFKWKVEFAPPESDIQWRNIRIGWWQQWIRFFVMVGIVAVLVMFWGVPVGFLAQWTNIDHLETFSWLHDPIVWLKSFGPWIVSVLTRLSPTVTLLIFMNILVPVLRILFDLVERPATRTGQETAVFRTYFAFLLFNVLFLSTLTSQISNIINEMVKNPSNTITDLAKHMGETWPVYGAFFINYIINSALLSGGLGITRIIFFFMHRVQLWWAKTEKEREQIKKEGVGGFEYDYQYAVHLNIFTIALAYSSMVPLILPTALLYFILWFGIDKYNLAFCYYDTYDRAGSWTPLVFRRVFLAVFIYHFTMFGTFLVKQNYIASGLLLPLFIVDLVIYWYALSTFTNRSQFVPLDEATRHPLTANQLGLDEGYIHPAMNDIPPPVSLTSSNSSYIRYATESQILEYQSTHQGNNSNNAPASNSNNSSFRQSIPKSLGDELHLQEM